MRRLGLGILALLFLWGGWRWLSLNHLRRNVAEDESAQRRFMTTLVSASQDNHPLPPEPKPDTSGWLANQALRGLDRRLLHNQPSAGGAGAEVKLRNLKPTEVLNLLTSMTRVNLVVRRLVLADFASRGQWEVHFIVEVPKP